MPLPSFGNAITKAWCRRYQILAAELQSFGGGVTKLWRRRKKTLVRYKAHRDAVDTPLLLYSLEKQD